MPLAMIRTNLGKWGKNTQTFYEHGIAVYTFRTIFNFPSQLIVANHARRCGMGQDLLNFYERLVFLESLYHDYDKLYVPKDMLQNITAMRKFEGHGNIEAPRNKESLNMVISDIESGKEDLILPTDVISFLRSIDENILRKVLRAANASHEGMRLPEKVELVKDALKSFFNEIGCPISDLTSLSKAHLLSLRSADSVASAWEGNPSFKSDVTEVVELIRSLQQMMGEPIIYITTISLNPTIFEARSSTVASSFLNFYDAIRKWVDTYLIRYNMNGLSVLRGSVIEDNSYLIAAIWLGGSQDSLKLSDTLKEIPKGILDDLFTLRQWDIRIVESKADFDVKLRNTLMNALYSGFKPVDESDGITCYSCGRPLARIYEPKDLRDLGINSKYFSNDLITLERSYQLGYLRAISPYIYGLRGLSHDDRPICPTCMWLLSRGKPINGTPVTFLFHGIRRRASLEGSLCSKEMDPLVERIFSYYLREIILARLWSVISTQNTRKYGLSVMVSDASKYGERLVMEVKDLLSIVMGKLEEMSIDLPCGKVSYEMEWGMRIGSGPISLGYVWDHTLLKGVWRTGDYLNALDWVSKAISYLKDLRLKPEEVAHKLEGGTARISAVLLKQIGGRPKGVTLDMLIRVVNFFAEKPGASKLLKEVINVE